jgi:hypothetical protein
MPRALKACPICGREMTGNNLARHVATHEPERRDRRRAPAASTNATDGLRARSP